MPFNIQGFRIPDGRYGSLTAGLLRNTLFNLLGWGWPALLSFISLPIVLSGLGNEAFGVFSMVLIAMGYLGLFHGPVATGNVRFLAEAFARQDWAEFRKTSVLGVAVVGSLAGLGAIVMAISANVLAKYVFKIPASLVGEASVAFRVAAITMFCNGVSNALGGILSAIRRFDILNGIGIAAGTMSAVGAVAAVWLGWGLIGVIVAQLVASALSLFSSCVAAILIVRGMRLITPTSGVKLDVPLVKRLMSFSGLLFSGSVISSVGLQLDRILVAMQFGATAMTFYSVPTKISDQTPNVIVRLTQTLYPLSAESLGRGQMGELRELYVNMVRISLWLTAFAATMVIISAHGILLLWTGPDVANHSWLVLVLLCAGVVWRGPGGVAFQVANGLGRGDLYLGISLLTLFSIGVPVLVLSRVLGLPGVALGVFIGLTVSNLTYELYTQRKLLGIRNVARNLDPYARTGLVTAGTVICLVFIHIQDTSWHGLILKTLVFGTVFILLSFGFGLLKKRDFLYIATRMKRASRSLA